VCLSQPPDRLTISIGEAIQLVLLFVDFFLDPLHTIHHVSVSSDFCSQQLIADLHKGLVYFLMEAVVAVDTEQLLVGVVRRGTMVAVRSCVDITLIYDSPFVRAPPYRGIHPHAQSNPFGWCNTSSIGCGNAEWDVVESAVADEALGSGG
jgi:hypothetical protein